MVRVAHEDRGALAGMEESETLNPESLNPIPIEVLGQGTRVFWLGRSPCFRG